MSYIQDMHDIALASVVDPDDHYYYRTICRKYSEKFNTPLHITFQLPYHTVLVNYFESVFENMHEDDLDEIVHRAVNPNYDEEDDIKDFIQMIEEESEGKRKPKRKTKIKPKAKDGDQQQESLMRNPPTDLIGPNPGNVDVAGDESDPLVNALKDLD